MMNIKRLFYTKKQNTFAGNLTQILNVPIDYIGGNRQTSLEIWAKVHLNS